MKVKSRLFKKDFLIEYEYIQHTKIRKHNIKQQQSFTQFTWTIIQEQVNNTKFIRLEKNNLIFLHFNMIK